MRNRGSLKHLLTRAMPGVDEASGRSLEQVGETEAVLRSKLRGAETYPGLDVDIDDLLAQGSCVRVPWTDRKSSDFVLFAAPPGVAANAEVRALWRDGEKVPSGEELPKELVRRKLRSEDELMQRARRKKDANDLAKALADQPKKQRTGNVRKWQNKHLGNQEELNKMFGNG